ncbi:hypothetical protein BDZ89DRAFT_248490 [Hymenopellis radicata]|nr:hypothetical protein BDZ89DRAFT_248490 [Hymenopellis radicata]
MIIRRPALITHQIHPPNLIARLLALLLNPHAPIHRRRLLRELHHARYGRDGSAALVPPRRRHELLIHLPLPQQIRAHALRHFCPQHPLPRGARRHGDRSHREIVRECRHSDRLRHRALQRSGRRRNRTLHRHGGLYPRYDLVSRRST